MGALLAYMIVLYLTLKYVFAFISISTVRKYLKNKPLGRQTLFNLTVCDLAFSVLAGSFVYTVVFITGLVFKPVILEIGIALTHLTVICAYNTYMCLFVALTTRYLSIYHPTILEGSNDIIFIKMLRCFTSGTVVFVYVVELMYRPENGKPGLFTSYTTGKMLAMLSMLILELVDFL